MIFLKICIMSLVIFGVTKISRKWGNEIGGMIASLPWIAGPILIFITLEQGISFAKDTVKGVMLGMISWLVFCFIYMKAGERFSPVVSLILSYLGYMVTGYLLTFPFTYLNIHSWFGIVMVLVAVAVIQFPSVNTQKLNHTSRTLKYDIVLRIVTASGFVALITYFASRLGPTWSGILTPFPIMTAVLAFFTHLSQGIDNAKLILRGMLAGIIGFNLFLYLQHFFLGLFTLPVAIILGLIVNLIVTYMMSKLLFWYFRHNVC